MLLGQKENDMLIHDLTKSNPAEWTELTDDEGNPQWVRSFETPEGQVFQQTTHDPR